MEMCYVGLRKAAVSESTIATH